jgi:hypothetical protein
MMIGRQKIEAVPQRSRLPNSASQPQPMLRSQFSDPGGGHGKKLSAKKKKAVACPLGIARIGSVDC